MSKTCENYRGIHTQFNNIMDELCIVLNPDYEENDDYRERIIDCYGKVSEMKNKLEDSVKNIKTLKVRNQYMEEFQQMCIWKKEINNRLKNDL